MDWFENIKMKNIRLANISDLNSINDIYNQAVLSKFETADLTTTTNQERLNWFNNHNENKYPIFVYEFDFKILGWISVSPYRQGRDALRYTVEISYYIHKDYKRRGIGSKLIVHTINECKKMNYKSLFAIILDKNIASIKLLTKYGFVQWGHMPDVANFDGEECGHVYYGLRVQ
jgi:L-amino acid N-acyltransferase YncA